MVQEKTKNRDKKEGKMESREENRTTSQQPIVNNLIVRSSVNGGGGSDYEPVMVQEKTKNRDKQKGKMDDRDTKNELSQCSNISNQTSSKKRKRKEVAVFGNYRNYYGYRVGQDLEDPRLNVFKREWFEDKDCLDIGCNSGFITIAIAKKLCCRSILGVDIDGARIEDAHWTLRKVVKTCTAHKTTPKTQLSDGAELVKSCESIGNQSLNKQSGPVSRDSDLEEVKGLLDIVSFQKGNFVQNWHAPENKRYNVILCLSVSKWIHLNWGDDGLITLFWRVWRLLQPGGIFILEPQPWSSYSNNRLVSETTAANYKNIQIAPEDFQDVLLDKIGFRRVEDLTCRLSGTKSGFNRPILAFWK